MTTAQNPDNYHALLSASRAPKFIPCVGSVALEETLPNPPGGPWAAEGTAGHDLAARVLGEDQLVNGKVVARGSALSHLGEVIEADGLKFTVDKAFADAVQKYVDYVHDAMGDDGILFIEKRVDYSSFVGVGSEDATGSSDAIIYRPSIKTLIVPDLKFGMGVAVSAIGNPQPRLYSLGAINLLGEFTEVDTITSAIVQPRIEWTDDNGVKQPSISEETLPIGELLTWAETTAKPQFILAKRLFEDLRDGKTTIAEIDAAGHLVPGEKQCKFCRAAGICPAYTRETLSTVIADGECSFEDLDAAVEAGAPLAKKLSALIPDAATISAERLAQNFLAVDLIEHWCKAQRAEVERRMLDGQTIPDPSGGDLKLVQGRQGPRKWIDETAAEAALKAARLKVDEMYDKTVISPTSAEKLLKEKPKVWAKLQGHITRSEGSLSVARAADKRPAAPSAAIAEDFPSLPPEDDFSSLA